MKRITIILSIVICILSGCVPQDNLEISERLANQTLPLDVYMIAISFRDALGSDLTVSLGDERWKPADDTYWSGGINPDKYNLDIILPNPADSWDNSIYNFKAGPGFIPDVLRPTLIMCKWDEDYKRTSYWGYGKDYSKGDGCWYLHSTFRSPYQNGLQDYLTYKITCSDLFNDNIVHELIVMWEPDPIVSGNTKDREPEDAFPVATKAIFDGKEITVNKIQTSQTEYRDFYTYFVNIILD